MSETERFLPNHVQYAPNNNDETRRRFGFAQIGIIVGVVISVFLVVLLLWIFVQDPIRKHHHNNEAKYPVVINTWNFINATRVAFSVLQNNSNNALDAVEYGCAYCETHPWECGYSVGFGGSPNEEGETTIDAMIMWAPTFSVGAVGYMKNISEGIAVARKVMEETYHTMLVGEDATNFAVLMGFQKKDLTTMRSYDQWYNWATVGGHIPNYWKHHHVYPNITTTSDLNRQESKTTYNNNNKDQDALRYKRRVITENQRPPVGPDNHDTIGMVAIGADGNVACGTSTNGMTFKIAGRLGDSPIPGTGAYCDNEVGGAAETGDGDVMMRFSPSVRVVELMRIGRSPTEACQQVVDHIAKYYPDAMTAIVAINKNGEHGAAYSNVVNGFPYSYQDKTMSEAEIIVVQNS